ncbi:MAG: hypothetical protein AAGF88_04925 [Pseudomonadota bacterium]
MRFADGWAPDTAEADRGVRQVVVHEDAFRRGQINPMTKVARFPTGDFLRGSHGLVGD